MLEFIIKQGDKQVGQLQFDSNWTYEDAMRVLGRYVMRELSPDESYVYTPVPRQLRDQEEAEIVTVYNSPGKTRLGIVNRPKAYGGGAAVPSPNSPFGLEIAKIEGIEILDVFATGKKHVMKYRGKVVTGNILAGLSAIYNLGGSVNEARDLQNEVSRDARYESTSDSEIGTLRYLMRVLVELGFVTEAEGGERVLTDVGYRMAEMFGKLSKPSIYAELDPSLSTQVDPEPTEQEQGNTAPD